jgi:hypothetical protein
MPIEIINNPPVRENSVSLTDKFRSLTCWECNLRVDSYIWGDRWEKASSTWLTPRAKLIFDLCYGLNGRNIHSYEATAKEFAVTRERVRQLFDKHRHEFNILVDIMNEKYKTGFYSQPIEMLKPWVTSSIFKAMKEMSIPDISHFMNYWPNKIDEFKDKDGIGPIGLNRIKNLLTIFYI